MAATNKPSSLPAFTQYANDRLQGALRQDYKNNSKRLGYPGKDEMDIVDQSILDASNTIAAMPGVISGYMHDEHRAFDLPAPDAKTAPATLKIVEVPKKTKTGTIQLGDRKGEPYTSTIAAHDEVRVKSRTKSFKK